MVDTASESCYSFILRLGRKGERWWTLPLNLATALSSGWVGRGRDGYQSPSLATALSSGWVGRGRDG